ncbi:sensor histidine kinase [Mastigocoleus testarum]|uniref:sensor histidine kinase n=1 Tax=Mastigocoleus testarum TaxID=996925 RepID=UPI00040C154B|nr:sensor histidine kinase [Mastigocoleus testarum]
MAKSRQSSFRRILVSRILLLSVPVLLIGEIIVFKKARSSLLETARQNLTESAVIKGEMITNGIAALKSNLISISQTSVIQSGSQEKIQEYLKRLKNYLPTNVECIQLTDVTNNNVINSTCGDNIIKELKLPLPSNEVDLDVRLPPQNGITGQKEIKNKLRLIFSVPVYDQNQTVKYILNLQTLLQVRVKNKRGILTGSTVVIDEDGRILAHPIATRVGTNIKEHADATRLQKIVKNAVAGRKHFLHLFFENEGQELLAGYKAIAAPVTGNQKEKWVVLAVTSLDNALYGLGQIKIILLILTLCLVGVSVLASLYLARDLALPMEELGDYAQNLHLRKDVKPVPHNFEIREFNQLAQALEQMVERLKAWANELEIAWEEAKGANQSKSQFLAATSHELRNPLNIIINCVRLVREDMCDSREEELEFLKRADDTAIHLLGIINSLLDISKIEAGKLSVYPEPIDLRKLLLDVINIQSVTVQQKGLQLNTPQMDEIIPVNADSSKLKQVLINIIGNATKFTEAGSITISTATETIEDKPQIIISVTDTGLGIEPSQQEKLFRPFVMVDTSRSRQFGGTGLGLAISRNLMEMMGGKIALESPGLDQGTTVKISLPLIDPALLSSSSTEARNNKSKSKFSPQIEPNIPVQSSNNCVSLNKESQNSNSLKSVTEAVNSTEKMDLLEKNSSQSKCVSSVPKQLDNKSGSSAQNSIKKTGDRGGDSLPIFIQKGRFSTLMERSSQSSEDFH